MTKKYYRFDKASGQMARMGLPEPIEIHGVIQDTIEPTFSNATLEKKVFTSRSALLEHYAQHGYKCTGGDHLLKQDKDEPDEAFAKRYYESILFEGKTEVQYTKDLEAECAKTVEQAYFDVKYGRVKFSEAHKEQHEQEKRSMGKSWAVKAPY